MRAYEPPGTRHKPDGLAVLRGAGFDALQGVGGQMAFAVGDYGVRAGFAKAFDLDPMPTEKEMGPLGEPFAPYRSIVAWWCWREVDTVTKQS